MVDVKELKLRKDRLDVRLVNRHLSIDNIQLPQLSGNRSLCIF